MKTVIETLQFAAKRHRKIFFIPNSGNAGDALINAGFYAIAQKIQLPYVETAQDFDYGSLSENDLVILPGGGYIVPYWDAGSATIRRLTQYKFPLLLLPQSIKDRRDVLSLLREKDTLFLREKYSYDYAVTLDLKCAISLDHDLAFSAKVRELIDSPPKLPPINMANSKRMLRIAYHWIRSRFSGSLLALRTDGESKLKKIDKRKINDIACIPKFGTKTRQLNEISAQWLLKILSWYKTVETDRLHVCIGSLLVGTRVILHDNAYHKIKGVYEYSIKTNPSFVPLVTLADDAPAKE